MGVNKNNDGNSAVILWGLLIIVFMIFLLYMIFIANQHPFNEANIAAIVIIGGCMTIGPDTKDRIARISAEEAAKQFAASVLPYLVRIEKRQNGWIKLFAIVKSVLAKLAGDLKETRIE